MLLQQGFRQRRVQALLQQGKLLLEVAHQVVIGVFGLLPREGKAPDLVALRFVEAGKLGPKAFEQVGFGHQHVDREADAQLLMQLDQTLAQPRWPGRHALRRTAVSRSEMLMVTITPLIGWRRRYFCSSPTNFSHSPASCTCSLSWVV